MIWLKNQTIRMVQVHRQLPPSVSRKFMAAVGGLMGGAKILRVGAALNIASKTLSFFALNEP